MCLNIELWQLQLKGTSGDPAVRGFPENYFGSGGVVTLFSKEALWKPNVIKIKFSPGADWSRRAPVAHTG